MKRDDLIHAIGDIDDDLILRADETQKRKRALRGWKKWGTVAACFVLIAAILFPIGVRIAKRNATVSISGDSKTVELLGDFETVDLMNGIVPRQRSGSPAPITDDAATAATDFALRLFREAYDGKNTLISPLSAMLALAMTANGAKGDTLAQMESAFGTSLDELNEFFYSYRAGLTQTEKSKLTLANSIWLRGDYDVLPAFLQTNADYYGADAFRAAFDEETVGEINEWVNEKTDGMIPELLDGISRDTVLYLINALAFDAEWDHPFSSSATKSGKFTKENGKEVNVDYMNGKEIGRCYLSNDQAQGIFKYYAGGKYAFVALLPNEDVSLSDFVASLDGESLRSLLTKPWGGVEVNVTLPKFEVKYTVDLSAAVKRMGMTSAFDYDADFSGITTMPEGVYVGSILQKTFLSMNEKGTRAGAATALEMKALSVDPPKQMTVRFTRPFVYMLVDTRNYLPLFIGTLNDPKK